jgi:hypothetical protein
MFGMTREARILSMAALLTLSLLAGSSVQAGREPGLSRGQTVYVPAYSHVYHGDKEHPFYVAATLGIRNTDPSHSITVHDVNYYDSKGKMLKKWLDKPVQIGPQSSEEYTVKESDKSGGFGAHFIIRWKSGHEVSPPLMESVIIGTSGQQGISFSTRGQAIREHP